MLALALGWDFLEHSVGEGLVGESLECEVFDSPDTVKIFLPLDSGDGPTVSETVKRFI